MLGIFWIYWVLSVYCEVFQNILTKLSIFKIYPTCVFNFPHSVLFDHSLSIFSLSHSGKVWLHGLSIFWTCWKYTNSVLCDHMTQYILIVTTQKWSQYLLITFVGNFKKYWALADGGYCGYNGSVFFNQSHNILGWEIVVPSFSIFWKNLAYSGSA